MTEPAEYKKKIVEEFVNLINEYPIIAAVDMENLPTQQLQTMRAQLREKVVLKMTKRRLMKIAFDKAKETKPGIEKLTEYLKGMPALLFTKDNPFKLYKILQKNKSPAPAKAGQIAPKDIVIPAGPTGFAPGPLIGELGMLGLKTGVENGKIAVKEDKVVVKEGEIIKPNVAGILTRFDIKPMEIGLDLTAAYEDGTIFTKKILHIDEKEYEQKFIDASGWAFNLAIDVGYPTEETLELMLSKAHGDSLALAISENILTSETVENVIATAEGQMQSLKQVANIPEVVEEVKETNKQEVVEEKSKEPESTVSQDDEKKEVPVVEDKKEEPTTQENNDESKLEVVEDKKEVTSDDIEKAEKLVEQIKKGSLNTDASEEGKEIEPSPSAEDLVNEVIEKDEAEKKKQEALKVPSAHELLQKKLEKEKQAQDKQE